jgi:3-mercaptopyruvate sulfurtransferase SseA
VADEIMQKFGYDNLRIYSGSFNEWKAKGGKIIDGAFQVDYES